MEKKMPAESGLAGGEFEEAQRSIRRNAVNSSRSSPKKPSASHVVTNLLIFSEKA
jgi:hypothetical protein